MNIKIETLIREVYSKQPSKKLVRDDFFNIDDKAVLLKNVQWFDHELMYVVGLIQFYIDGIPWPGIKYWDYPFWMYGQLHNQIPNVTDGGAVELQFLESDGSITIEPISEDYCRLKLIGAGKTISEHTVPGNYTMIALLNKAREAFIIADSFATGSYEEQIENFKKVIDKIQS